MEDIYRNGNYRRKSSHRSKHSAKTVSYRPQYNSNNRNNKNRKRRKKAKRMEEPKLNKKKVFMVIAIPILIIMFINNKHDKNIEVSGKGTDIKESQSTTETNNTNNINMPTQTTNTSTNSTQTTNKVEITDWKLRLANYDNLLPEDFEVELANIDNSKDPKQFDARAVKYLKDMINAMKKDGNTKIWCQSTFRSVKRQKELYDASVQKYLKQGKTQEEADKLTLEYINKPGGSDHNLGLAVDFNYVDNSFAKTSEYKWLLKNAENYGFILRYPEDKEDKTKIAYESWHWRYVGEENAKRMNELNMCLEEYVEYLQKGNK
jgi:D-alanyl-D-alanine carboxypeptidase